MPVARVVWPSAPIGLWWSPDTIRAMRRRLAAPILLGALSLLIGRNASAALPDELIVERLGEERGFPSGTITALYRDRAGFLWVGSREGLAFWDGYSIRS